MNIAVHQAKLSPATAIIADQVNTVITTSWRSARGLHIVTVQLPTERVLSPEAPELLEAAVLDFVLLVELEMLNERMCELGSESDSISDS